MKIVSLELDLWSPFCLPDFHFPFLIFGERHQIPQCNQSQKVVITKDVFMILQKCLYFLQHFFGMSLTTRYGAATQKEALFKMRRQCCNLTIQTQVLNGSCEWFPSLF